MDLSLFFLYNTYRIKGVIMKILIIGKPTYNVILPVANYLAEGSKTLINEKHESGGGSSFYVASLFGKWRTSCYYTGVVGSDIYGNKIKADLEEFGVDIKYLETNYEYSTAMNYILLNAANGSSTQIIKDNSEVNLVKYKYEFNPDFIIMDGTDMSGSLAAVNNFPKATSILLANKISNDIHALSKKVTHVVANVGFAQALAKMEIQIGKPKQLVAFMQKIKDLNKAEYIVMLRDHGVLYSSERQVKMIPAIDIDKKVDDTNSGNIFFAAFCYGLVNGYGIDASVKMANISAGLSLTKMGTINSIPSLEEVLEIGVIQKPGEEPKPVDDTPKPPPVQVGQEVQSEATTTDAPAEAVSPTPETAVQAPTAAAFPEGAEAAPDTPTPIQGAPVEETVANAFGAEAAPMETPTPVETPVASDTSPAPSTPEVAQPIEAPAPAAPVETPAITPQPEAPPPVDSGNIFD